MIRSHGKCRGGDGTNTVKTSIGRVPVGTASAVLGRSFEAQGEGRTTDTVIAQLLARVALP